MSVKILQGDCRDVLATLPAESVHCCVTSPPYWGLRDYGVAGQIGLEPTIAEYIAEMVSVFRAVHRVLRPEGTCWINLGDSYASHDPGGYREGEFLNPEGRPPVKGQARNRAGTYKPDGLKRKDLIGVPWRVAFALQADGWYLRQDIIWAKPNPMPESVTDRCTKSHEYIFLLSKGPRYFYDAEAIKEAATEPVEWLGSSDAYMKASVAHDLDGPTRDGSIRKRPAASGSRNKRSVWTVATAPFPEAHFATFPPDLIEPCIKAGTSEKGCCRVCGAPWVRETDGASYYEGDDGSRRRKTNQVGNGHGGAGRGPKNNLGASIAKTIGWQPTCTCDAGFAALMATVPCTVLDPFGGSGTTGLVADRQQRNAIIIELNRSYAEMAKRRLFADAPLFAAAE